MNVRDTLERLFWTLVAAFFGSLAISDFIGITAVQAGLAAAATAGTNFILLVARARLSVLPDPGEGLPLMEQPDPPKKAAPRKRAPAKKQAAKRNPRPPKEN